MATGRRRALLALLAGYLGVGAGLGWDALRWESRPEGGALGGGERARRSLRVALFNAFWLAVVPRALLNMALRGGPVRYEKMAHDGAAGAAWDSSTDTPR